jgi:DnaK suppressor protein
VEIEKALEVVMGLIPEDVVIQCKQKLLESKMEILNRVRDNQMHLISNNSEKGGDEADQTTRIIEEKTAIANQNRLRQTLLEIEAALGRIENGSYGICEETEEPIETERLLAIPWTRLSIEGAEIREAQGQVLAR